MFAMWKVVTERGDGNGAPVRSVLRERSAHRHPLRFRGAAIAVAAFLLGFQPVHADAIDALSIETRAQLAVAASAYPPSETPGLDPDSAGFAPDTVASYLFTNDDVEGVYGSGTALAGRSVSFGLMRFADDAASAAELERWKAAGDAAVPLDWGGSFPAFRHSEILFTPTNSMISGGIFARGQAGRWNLEVNVFPAKAGEAPGPGEIAAAVEAMQTLARNVARYRVLESAGRALRVQLEVAGSKTPVGAGERFQVPLRADAETRASFELQVVDGAAPVAAMTYLITLSGALAAVAELEQDGARTQRSSAEARSPDGQPVVLTWVFPPATAPALAGLIDGDLSLGLDIEARPAPQVVP